MVTISSYHMFFYTAWISDLDLKDVLGTSNMVCLGIIFLLNVVTMGYIWIRSVKIKCRQRKGRKHAREMERRAKEAAKLKA